MQSFPDAIGQMSLGMKSHVACDEKRRGVEEHKRVTLEKGNQQIDLRYRITGKGEQRLKASWQHKVWTACW